MADPITDKPWYRQLWPWLVMLPPAAAVIGGFLTAWLAGGPPALVVDDYGEIAMVTQARAERDERARVLGLSAMVSLPAGGSPAGPVVVTLDLPAADYSLPETIELQLVHPTREELDRRAILTRAQGQYEGMLDRPPGRLYLQLADAEQSWRLVGELAAADSELLLRAPERGR